MYKSFFVGELKSIFKLLSIFFDDDYEEGEWLKSYDDAMTYQIILSKCLVKGRYIKKYFMLIKLKKY